MNLVQPVLQQAQILVMASNTPGSPGVLENVVLGTVHMNIKKGSSTEIIDLIVTSFLEEEILSAKTELIKSLGMTVPAGHRDTAERTAASLYAKELVALVHQLDHDNKMPKVVVSSDQLGRVPFGKNGLLPSEAVPISARMNNLEDTVKKLCESFEKFKVDNQTKTFASIAASGAVNRNYSGRQAAPPSIQVTSPGASSSWAAEMEGQVVRIPLRHCDAKFCDGR